VSGPQTAPRASVGATKDRHPERGTRSAQHKDAAVSTRPIVVVTGSNGAIGSALRTALQRRYRVVGFDLSCGAARNCIEADFSNDASVALALRTLAREHGRRIAAVVHLAAYFDFTGEADPRYRSVNVDGTRRLLEGLAGFTVERFVYSSTMLVHAPCSPGERIDEQTPLGPKWAYPESKAEAEAVITATSTMPYVLLRLAGVYDERVAVPTLAQQIARIYEREMTSHLYAGDAQAGQSMVHRDDAIAALVATIERRATLPRAATILIGEPDAVSYDTLQDRLGALIHGEDTWRTLRVAAPVARVGSWLQGAAEPLVPDPIDRGEKPFIRPFMIAMASDHYALDIRVARETLGWEPKRRLAETLPQLVNALKEDPIGWYRKNGVRIPPWLESAAEAADDPEAMRRASEERYRRAHAHNLWARFAVLGLGAWLIAAPATLGYASSALAWSDILSGFAALAIGLLALSWRFGVARWATAVVGLWVATAPLIFWTPSAAGYLNGTLVGALLIGFAVAVPPAPGISAAAARSEPEIPSGWDYSPSSWSQRAPIIALAFVGLFISRYLAAYQLGHIDAVWEPFFAGGADPKNGTEEIITSSVSRAWPVPDAGLGALTYLLEILTGLMGATNRWRSMPWLVLLFGLMIVPLGAVSITFIVIQPIVLGTWCTLCLVAAGAMLLQIPYSLDELLATWQFLRRRRRAGKSLLRVLLVGDTDEGMRRDPDNFESSPRSVLARMLGGGVAVPWNLALCIGIGVWLMLTRLTFGTAERMANADHLIGSLVVTVSVIAWAEIARPLRFFNVALGVALWITPFVHDVALVPRLSSLICGAALVALSLRRGPVRQRWGGFERFLV